MLSFYLATGQISSLSKLMMQHEVTWLFRRSPRLHMVSSVIIRWTSRLHTAVRGDVVYLGMSIYNLQKQVSDYNTRYRRCSVHVQLNWTENLKREKNMVLQKDRRKYMYMDVERSGQKVLKYCKRENSNV